MSIPLFLWFAATAVLCGGCGGGAGPAGPAAEITDPAKIDSHIAGLSSDHEDGAVYDAVRLGRCPP